MRSRATLLTRGIQTPLLSSCWRLLITPQLFLLIVNHRLWPAPLLARWCQRPLVLAPLARSGFSLQRVELEPRDIHIINFLGGIESNQLHS